MEIHFHFHESADLSEVLSKLSLILSQQEAQMASITELEAEVARNTTVDESAIALIEGIVARLEEAAGDQVKIDALTADLRARNDALAAAVAANTPSEPPTE